MQWTSCTIEDLARECIYLIISTFTKSITLSVLVSESKMLLVLCSAWVYNWDILNKCSREWSTVAFCDQECSFVHQRWLGCWQSMWHTSSQRWGLELATCATPLTLGLVLYILRAQLSLRVSLARCQWCSPVLQVEPLAPAICYLTTPRRPQSGCDGLSQFKSTQASPVYLPENLIS